MKNPIRRLSQLIPIIYWLPRYQIAWLLPDLIAGVTLAAYAVPVAMAYATLAGLAPQAGLYCYIYSAASPTHFLLHPVTCQSVLPHQFQSWSPA